MIVQLAAPAKFPGVARRGSFAAAAPNGQPRSDQSATEERIPYGQHDTFLTSIAGRLRRDVGLEERAIAEALVEI